FAGNAPTWTPIFPLGYRLGRALLGYDRRTVPRLNWHALFHADITLIFHPIDSLHRGFCYHSFLPGFLSFLVGTPILASLIGFAAYPIVRSSLQLYHLRHPQVAIRAAHRRKSGEWQKKTEK